MCNKSLHYCQEVSVHAKNVPEYSCQKKAESIMKHTKSIHRGGLEKKKKCIFILRIQVYQIIMVIFCTISKALSVLASIQESIMLFKKHAGL